MLAVPKAKIAILAKVMADPRMEADMTTAPFDGKRMIFGGFRSFVALSPATGRRLGG